MKMVAHKSITSMTKMPICGNWLHHTWAYFHQGHHCLETVPNP